MRIFIYLILAAALFSAACQSTTQTANNKESVKRDDFRGKVVSVDKNDKTAKIAHDEVVGLMPAMTMDFPIHEDWIWEDLVPGVEIRAQLVEDKSAKEPYVLENVAIVANSAEGLPAVEEKTPEQIGKPAPNVSLTDQDGKKFNFADYHGKALAVTFIYRECPLPEFCIKMSRQFSDMAKQIAADPDAKDKVRLLSISFDPARDTPEKLRQYGLGYLGSGADANFNIWRLAVGSDKDVRTVADFFGMKYETDANDKTQINHSLVTAVIGPDGNVKKLYTGGRWTADEVMSELKAVSTK